jgi:hypothetical protein
VPPAVSVTLDPDGRRVVLEATQWEHVKVEHPLLRRRLRAIMAAVREPFVRMSGRGPDEVWFFAEDAGRYPWLQVVVHYEGGEGWIVTAFPRVSLPGR